jgi:hypothetical protein
MRHACGRPQPSCAAGLPGSPARPSWSQAPPPPTRCPCASGTTARDALINPRTTREARGPPLSVIAAPARGPHGAPRAPPRSPAALGYHSPGGDPCRPRWQRAPPRHTGARCDRAYAADPPIRHGPKQPHLRRAGTRGGGGSARDSTGGPGGRPAPRWRAADRRPARPHAGSAVRPGAAGSARRLDQRRGAPGGAGPRGDIGALAPRAEAAVLRVRAVVARLGRTTRRGALSVGRAGSYRAGRSGVRTRARCQPGRARRKDPGHGRRLGVPANASDPLVPDLRV